MPKERRPTCGRRSFNLVFPTHDISIGKRSLLLFHVRQVPNRLKITPNFPTHHYFLVTERRVVNMTNNPIPFNTNPTSIACLKVSCIIVASPVSATINDNPIEPPTWWAHSLIRKQRQNRQPPRPQFLDSLMDSWQILAPTPIGSSDHR